MNVSIDALIDQQHAETEQAEERAREVHNRLRMVPGLDAWLNRHRRSYGMAPNPWRDGNLSAQALIQRSDPALAHFLARDAGKGIGAPDYGKVEAEERRNASIRAMEQQTEALRQRNALTRQRHTHEAKWGRVDSFHGRVV